MRIDSHHHFWTRARGDYGWLTPEAGPLWRDFTMADLAPHLDAHAVEATILVQAADTVAETAFLLDIAAADPRIAGVVGWVDFAHPAAPATIAALARDAKLKGLRPMLQDMAETGWILEDACRPALEAMTAHGLAFDALVRPRHLPAIATLARRHPDLPIVLDHGGKPDPRADLANWRADLRELARAPNVFAKLSGLVTEAGAGWTIDEVRPVAEALLEAFGPNRLMWGSDWPVLLLAGDYGAWWRATAVLLDPLTPAERDLVLGGTAARFYRLGG